MMLFGQAPTSVPAAGAFDPTALTALIVSITGLIGAFTAVLAAIKSMRDQKRDNARQSIVSAANAQGLQANAMATRALIEVNKLDPGTPDVCDEVEEKVKQLSLGNQLAPLPTPVDPNK